MSQKQRIFNLLAKKPATKLSATRKVKFSFADDAAAAANALRGAQDEVASTADLATSAVEDVKAALERAVSFAPGLDRDMIQDTLDKYDEAFQEANQIADEFKRAADQLGIDPYDSPAFQTLVDTIENGAQITFKLLIARDDVAKYADLITNISDEL